jgi:hypothetical protein
MKFLRSKCPLIVRIYLWYYRLLQTTFGGLTIDSNGDLATNKYLKYYGFIVGLLITVTEILGLYSVLKSNFAVEIYNSGSILTYYFCITFNIIDKIRVLANLWFLQFNGIKFFEIFYYYKTERTKNLYLLFTLWILHILMPIIFGVYHFFSSHQMISYSMLSLRIIQNFFSYSVAWSVSFLMWNVSVQAFENLVHMKQVLVETIKENSGKKSFKFLINFFSNSIFSTKF